MQFTNQTLPPRKRNFNFKFNFKKNQKTKKYLFYLKWDREVVADISINIKLFESCKKFTKIVKVLDNSIHFI